MEESEDSMSSEDVKFMINPSFTKTNPKKRSLVERELETTLTARVTSPMMTGDGASTSRYGRTRRIKVDSDYIDTEKCIKITDSPSCEKTPVKLQSPVYKMHASNSPIKLEPKETPIKSLDPDSSLNNQIENIYNENNSLSRFSSEEKKSNTPKFPKVYVRKDLIQSREKEDYVTIIKHMFSPPKSARKRNSHLNNILERSSEKYSLNTSMENLKSHSGFLNNSSVVKTLDFDGSKKKKKENRDGKVLSKSDLFELEAKCEYQVGDLAWARMGTFPFWPCIVTREPATGMFVKKKLFGRIERDIIHVTFFGDNGRRGWILDSMLRRFLGQLEFEATRESFSPSEKKKDPRLYAAFFVSEKRMPQWNISVEEAEVLLREPKRLRIDILYDMLAKSRSAKSTPKHQKSGKVARTASDVASDVSLSESLYDTLFSEDDGKSDDTERLRNKTRMSLDVSEVVTACLDNMAAKTGITKIQRQSHMDRWLQKAKSKTPEKSQANLPPPMKDTKAASAKTKNKVNQIIVPIQKPYSLRKMSYEPQILKSNDNEHDYSTKITDNTPQTCSDVQVNDNFDISFEVKVESLHDKADESVDETKGDIDTDCEVLNQDSSITSLENTNKGIEIGPIDITDEQDEIQENMCSVEENEELLLGQTEKQIGALTNQSNPDNQSVIPKIPDNISADKKVEEKKHKYEGVNKGSEKIMDFDNCTEVLGTKSVHITEEQSIEDIQNRQVTIAQRREIIKDSKRPTRISSRKTQSEYRTKGKTIEEIQTMASKNMVTDKQVPFSKTPEIKDSKKSTRTSSRRSKVKLAESKVSLDFSMNSPEFVKYLELRQDTVMDEHPELSQSEIEEYLYKTWQYEESAKFDFKKTADTSPISAKSNISGSRKNRKCLSLNSSFRNRIKKREKEPLPKSSSSSDVIDNNNAQLNLPSTSRDSNEGTTSFSLDTCTVKDINIEKDTAVSKTLEITHKAHTDETDVTKLFDNNANKEKTDPTLIVAGTSGRRSLRLSKSPAIAKDVIELGINVSDVIKTDENNQPESIAHFKKTKMVDQQRIDIPGPSTADKDRTDTIPIAAGRRSLRNRLSRSPATPKNSIETKSNVSKESSTTKSIESNQNVTELAENQSEMFQKIDEHELDIPKLSEDIEKVDTTPIVPSTSGRKSLRIRASKSPATKNTSEIINNVSKENNTEKSLKCDQIVADHSCIKTLPGMTEDELTMDISYSSDIDIPKIETAERKSLRTRLSNTPAKSKDANERTVSTSDENNSAKIMKNIRMKYDLKEKLSGSTQKLNEQVTDSLQLSVNKESIKTVESIQTESEVIVKYSGSAQVDKEKSKTTLIVADTSVRRSRRTKLMMSLAMAMEANEMRNQDCNTDNEIIQTTAPADKSPERTRKPEGYIDKDKKETLQVAEELTPKPNECDTYVNVSQKKEYEDVKNKKETLQTPVEITEKPNECDILLNVSQKAKYVDNKDKKETLRVIEESTSKCDECDTRVDVSQIEEYENVKNNKGTFQALEEITEKPNKCDILVNVSQKANCVDDKDRNETLQVAAELTPKPNECNTRINVSQKEEYENVKNKKEALQVPEEITEKSNKCVILVNVSQKAKCVDDKDKKETLQVAEQFTQKPNECDIYVNVSQKGECKEDKDKKETLQAVEVLTQKPNECNTRVNIEQKEECDDDRNNKETLQVAEENDLRNQIETTEVADKPKINKDNEIEVVHGEDKFNQDAQKRLETTMEDNLIEEHSNIIHLTDEPIKDSEKPKSVTQTAIQNCAYTEDNPDFTVKAALHDSEAKIIDIQIMEESCTNIEKTNTTVDSERAQTPKTGKVTEITDQPQGLDKTALNGIDIQNQIVLENEVSIIGKPIGIFEERIVDNKKEKQTEISPIVHKPKTDEIPVEDKEYGHLDFVFSALNEKLQASNDINEIVIRNKTNVSNTDSPKCFEKIEGAEIIHREEISSNNNVPKSDLTILSNDNATSETNVEKTVESFAEAVQSNNKETTINDFIKCKYNNLFKSCTALRVNVERLPRLSRKVIKIKDLDREISLSNTRPIKVTKRVLKLNRKVATKKEDTSEQRIKNGHDKTCTEHTKADVLMTRRKSDINKVEQDNEVTTAMIENVLDRPTVNVDENEIESRTLSDVLLEETRDKSAETHMLASEQKSHRDENHETSVAYTTGDALLYDTNQESKKDSIEKDQKNTVIIIQEECKQLTENRSGGASAVHTTTDNNQQNDDLNPDDGKISVEDLGICTERKNTEDIILMEEQLLMKGYTKISYFDTHQSKSKENKNEINTHFTTTLKECKDNIKHNQNKHNPQTVDPKPETVKIPQVKTCPIAKKSILPKVDFRPVAMTREGIPDQIKPSPLANGYDYLFDEEDDEEEFESPAFSPIFKEPIEPDKKANEAESGKEPEAVTDKDNSNLIDNSKSKTGIPESPIHKSNEKNKDHDVVISKDTSPPMKQENGDHDKDEFMTAVSRLPEPVKINGFHHLDEYGLDCSDNDFNVETSSINSEDSEPLSVTKSKLFSRNRKNTKKALDDVEFVKYLEMRQDALMDEHPELNQEEIVDYLYKTWQYEENSKSDIRKNDDIEQAVLVKGLNENLRQKSMRNRYRENKKKSKKVEDDVLSINSNISNKSSKKGDEDTLSVNSHMSDSSVRRSLRRRISNSPVISIGESEFSLSKESSPERKPDIEDKTEDTDDFIKITRRKVRNQILDDSLDGEDFIKKKPDRKDESLEQETVKIGQSRPKRTLHKKENKSPKAKESKIEKYFEVVSSTKETKSENTNEKLTVDINQIKEEPEPDTISIASVNSEDSEVSLSKRKQRRNADKQTKSMDDPEFLKYVELRQDVLIDENPQLTQEEIVAYLYKTWLYEESVKSDLKKSDEIEQANLVKGLNTEVQPKKVRKKIKTEKCLTDEEVAKEKPKRKTYQPYYNEDTISDIEEEIELFEIFRTNKKKSVEIKSEEINEVTKSGEDTSTENDKTEEVVTQQIIDEVELYFANLLKPKPNVFKGLVREKVCEICEKKNNLVKCKVCSGMFHVDCQQKDPEKEAGVPCQRGRKKKKKPGRKPKNLDDSGSHSDDKSQDVSEEHNASIEDIPEPRVVDEAVLEAALTSKMKEILPTIDLTYDSYSSDDGLDWNSALPGHCEIVDIKLKPKVADYSDFKCSNCQRYSTPVCFVCKRAVSKTGVERRQKCQTNHCNKYYHLECLDHWPQTQFNSGDLSKKKNTEHTQAVMCPRHVCHTCVSDDPRGCRTRFSGDKLARCVRCPATYHSFTKCLPAGSQILTGSLIVCPRHHENRPGKAPCHVNTGWCFICALGGSLICCEYCPTSFHAECLNIKPPEGGYMCEDCETGRLPLYGEMVWVKLGHYRWWPGIILHPSEIPENILAVKHSPGEFVVRFFGQYDHYWVNRGRVFPFQEGDSGRISTQKSKIDADFITAMEHAHRAFEILKTAQPNDEESLDIASSLLPPHYVKLKVNKPCGSLIGRRPDIEESSLTQCECDPLVEDPCGPYSHCLNRMLLTECGPICRAGDRCSNRAFEKRLYPKMVPYRTPHRGWGLKTLEDIKAGQFVIEYVGELIDEEEFKRRMSRMHEIRDENFYFLTLDKERMIDAGPKGNLARFMNHCCEPNCETQKWTVLGDVRVGLFAINDIPANSEVTFNYNLQCAGIEKKRCLCGARRCSGYIGAKPKQIEETQPKKKRAYKKRAKPAEESPSTTMNKPKRPVGRPPKPRELTEIEKDLLIIKNATNDISSESETNSRLSSIDNPNPKALKRKRVSLSTEESVCSSPSSKKSKDDSPSVKKLSIDECNSPSTKKARIDDYFTSPTTRKVKIEDCATPSSSKKLEDPESSPVAKKLKIEDKCEVGD